jgi:peroxin-2
MGQVNAEATSSRVTLDHPRAPKVAQVDADELDEGLVHMLGERVERAVGNFKVSYRHLETSWVIVMTDD